MNDSKSKLAVEMEDLIRRKFPDNETALKYLERIKSGDLTKHENSKSHLCAYFAPYDPVARQVFIGHHRKSGLWLFNGGHIDEGETLRETLRREIDEEWGLDYENFDIKEPSLLTITEIYNPTKQPCREHFDIWHFVPVDMDTFNPNKDRLAEEFYENRWVSLNEAREMLIKDASSIEAIEFIEDNLINQESVNLN